jgi:sulfatase modifying factor 1
MSVRKPVSAKSAAASSSQGSTRVARSYRKLLLWGVLLVLAPAVVGAAVSLAVKSHESPHPQIVFGDGSRGPLEMAWVPGGQFEMGSDSKQAQANERPAHKVRVHGFWMDRHHVTNAQFAAFVKATGYVTTAEKKPDWESLKVQLPPGTPRPPDNAMVAGAMVFVGTGQPVPLED